MAIEIVLANYVYDIREYIKSCGAYQRIEKISRKNEMSLTIFLEVELFDL